MANSEFVLSGPEFTSKEFIGSVAEYLVPKVRSYGEQLAQVEVKTGESVTARQFLQMCLEVTEGLIKWGLKEGDVVVLGATNSIRATSTLLGIMFSGAVVSPIDQNLKPFEIQSLLKKFNPKLVICEAEKAKEFRKNLNTINLEAPIVVLDSVEKDPKDDFYAWNDIRTNVDIDNYTPRKVRDPKVSPAAIYCSSGSTGLPKGVILSHYSILLHVFVLEDHYLNFVQPILLNSPLFWISSVIFLVNSVYFGQPGYIPESSNGKHLAEAMEKSKPIFIVISPAGILSIVDLPDFESYNLESVKLILVGGSSLGAEVAEKIKKKWPSVTLFQCYGATEAGGEITDFSGTTDLMSVGKVVKGAKLKVVDTQTGESLGPNKVGEIRVKTKGVMVGYYNDEKATKDAFDENGWLRSGDLGYYNEEGYVYLTGRIKEIIKYRNYQISPTEIESFLVCLPGVKDAAVVPVPHVEDHYHLKALIVRAPKSDITEDEIIQSVKDNLSSPKHLRKGVEFVTEIPRTGTGKLRRGEINKMF